MATLEKLQAQIAKLQSRAEALVAKQSTGVIEKIRKLMEEHGLTTADIDAHQGSGKRIRQSSAKAVSAPRVIDSKYRDPKSGATWSGRGRAPAWIASAKDRTRFLIEATGASQTRPTPGNKKAGNYVRGPQPAKYRDPKTGATWSGRGPAPTWLSGVKDRAAFLIDGAPASNEVKEAPAKKAAKKVAPKKLASKKAVAKNSPAKATEARAPRKVTATKAPAKKAVAKKAAAKKAAKKAPVSRTKVETASVVPGLPSADVAASQAAE